MHKYAQKNKRVDTFVTHARVCAILVLLFCKHRFVDISFTGRHV